MQPQTITHATYFTTFITKLAIKFQPLQIFNFSKNSSQRNNQGCFSRTSSELSCHYCLLLVTADKTGIDHEVQDFANAYYRQGTVTVICHSREAIETAIADNNRFFITVYAEAELVYSHDGMFVRSEVPSYITAQAAANARKHYDHRFSVAEGFYLGASDCLTNWEQYTVCVFMLHQAVEQLCVGLIRIHLGYRSNFHSLSRLLHLCGSFSQKPLQLFTESTEDKRLFSILTKSYSAARYQSSFVVCEKDATSLCNKVSDFTALATRLCKEKIMELEEVKELVAVLV